MTKKNTVRQQVLAANWKMYKTLGEARDFALKLLPLLKENSAQVIICPPATLLNELQKQFSGSVVAIGAQNIHWEDEGAYTGEISALQAADAGAAYCLAGHSERRRYFGETGPVVALKAAAALKAGLIPVVCVGESLQERENGLALTLLHDDIQASLKDIEPTTRLMIAYEPVWAIGTGRVATPQDAEDAIAHIRASLAEIWGNAAQKVSILYGGSVKPDNIGALLACPNIDGALVGGASLSAASFAAIVNAAG
ncbi:MAG: triose-phosphate isomerase [Clostridiales bacterium]|nr:triose-phosphate isomerase [Clostridiales bacterium]